MSHYGITEPSFWDGPTGTALAAAGCPAQVVAHYLMANRQATMIGLYQLSLDVAERTIGSLSTAAFQAAILAVEDAGFARYDAPTGVVWVLEMAKFRLGLHRKPINADDNRVKHVQRLYATVKPNPFLSDFYRRYRKDLYLEKRRTFQGAYKGLPRPLQGASKPVTETDLAVEQKIRQKDQRADARASHGVLVKLVHVLLDERHLDTLDADSREELKVRAAQAGIAYDGDAIRKACDAAEHQHRRHERSA